MKHLLFLIIVTVVGYALWSTTDTKERNSAMSAITRHGLRLGALILLLLLLVAAAVYLPASSLL